MPSARSRRRCAARTIARSPVGPWPGRGAARALLHRTADALADLRAAREISAALIVPATTASLWLDEAGVADSAAVYAGWQRLSPAAVERHGVSVATGGLAGEAVTGIIIALLLVLGALG